MPDCFSAFFAEIKQTSTLNAIITDRRLKKGSNQDLEVEVEGSVVKVFNDESEATFTLSKVVLSPLSCRGLRLSPFGEVTFTMQIESSCWKIIKPQKLDSIASSQDELVDKIKLYQDKCFCAKCGKKIITNHSLFQRILPLPSDNWSAHTDMWFCHNHGNDNTDYKSISLLPKSGECFVGSCYFLVQSKHLCVEDHNSGVVCCQRCKTELGAKVVDKNRNTGKNNYTDDVDVYKIFSQSVIFVREDLIEETFDTSQSKNSEAFFAKLISEQSHRYTSFRLILSGVTGDKEIQCLIWLIDPNMLILQGEISHQEQEALTDKEQGKITPQEQGEVVQEHAITLEPKPAMKLLYKCHYSGKNRCSKIRANVFDEWMRDNNVHGFNLPYSLCYNIITSLSNSTKQLPKSHRCMNSFLVGFLRYDR